MQKIKRFLIRIIVNKSMFIRIIFEKLFFLHWNNYPFGNFPLGCKEEYLKLFEESKKERYLEVDNFEVKMQSKISQEWIDNLALYTQVTKKKSKICYAHGRVLFSALSNYIDSCLNINKNKIIIFETGTARGFSSLCMALALKKKNVSGLICTFDVLPHNVPIYWNSISDENGPISRSEILKPWKNLVQEYILFIQGNTLIELPKFNVDRINFAFLDGAHTYNDIMFEFSNIQTKQLEGDIIIYDDYSPKKFPELVKAIDEICENFKYSRLLIKASDERSYLIAQKL